MLTNRILAHLPFEPLVSCLCVTEGRAAFMPWLLWCFDRQTWPTRELVIVDSSEQPFEPQTRGDIRVLTVPPRTGIARKRNLALQASHGDVIAWFDDDDWQHPQKLGCLVEELRDGRAYAGSAAGWFVDLGASRCEAYCGPRHSVVFNSAAFRRDTVLSIPFPEDLRRASDTRWMRAVATRHGRSAVVNRDDLFFWLSHDANVSNPARKRSFPHDLSVLRDRVGAAAWADTDVELELLRTRLKDLEQHSSTPAGGAKHTSVSDEERESAENIADARNHAKPARVSLLIKATMLDAPFLDVMVRHLVGQARFPFVERTMIVDRSQTRRPTGNGLDHVLDGLLRDGVVDQVREVDLAPETIERVTAQYFAVLEPPSVRTLPLGSGYATLFGLESMATDHIVQTDADILFHTGPTSWISRAMDCMSADPSLWLMMTHPGPPAGPVGKSLRGENELVSTWDPHLRLWRFRHATTRYFLCDRRMLRHRLPIVRDGKGNVVLEQCISRALQQSGGFRGTLGDLESWHLHVRYHGSPFPEWAEPLTRAVRDGVCPEIQSGRYDLRLDRVVDREAWERLLFARDQAVGGRVFRGLDRPSARRPATVRRVVPISVVIPVRDRAGQRLRNALRSLQWQSAGPPEQVLVASHGSRPEVDEDLKNVCREEGASLITLSGPGDPWNKSVALNAGIRRSSPDSTFVMTMDADMVLSPDFIGVVINRLRKAPPALVLCRIADLLPDAHLPVEGDALRERFGALRLTARLRSRAGSGGIQAASRSFFCAIRGYDEDLVWWGAMDGDVVHRARLMGLEIEWVDDRTTMLHQWHPRKHASLTRPDHVDEARRAWRENHALVRARRHIPQRNPDGWGGESSDQLGHWRRSESGR